MGIITSIRLKALFLLLVFTSGTIAFCHCNHAMATSAKKVIKTSCCHKAKTGKAGSGCCDSTPGCCGGETVKFNSQDKKTVEEISVNPVFLVAFTYCYHYQPVPDATSGRFTHAIQHYKWRAESTPGIYLINRTFLI